MDNDLISRQEAIDAICKACSMEGDYHKCDGYPETSTWCEELVALRALPSAQPEIIRCNDCQHSEYDALFGDRYCHHNGKAEIVPDDHYCGYGRKENR